MQLLRKLAFPIALLYGIAVRLRNLCYDWGVFSSRAFDTPTIAVGNLSTGGTGKTPMVEMLVAHFRDTCHVAVLSRGYRRKTRGFVLADKDSTARDIGDEPYQIYTKFPGITVAVDADRQRGIGLLQERLAPDLIILDDAFQHRRVRPDIALLLSSYGDLYVDDCYLPAGNLRDSPAEARRADLIIVTKCPASLSQTAMQEIRGQLGPRPHQQVLFACLEYDMALKGGKQPPSLEALRDKPVALVTGIANPDPLVAFLKSKGIHPEHFRFGDHHYFSREEMAGFGGKPVVLTTEKDYRRIDQPPPNLHYIAVKHSFLGNGEQQLLERLKYL